MCFFGEYGEQFEVVFSGLMGMVFGQQVVVGGIGGGGVEIIECCFCCGVQ